jgi:cell division protein ZapA (FtsZ GTPase activity inhibitor)
MTPEAKDPLAITIGDQTFRLRVEPSRHAHFLELAQRVNRDLKDIAAGGVLSGPRALAMEAFQLAVEADEMRTELGRTDEGRRRIAELIQRIDRLTGKAGE